MAKKKEEVKEESMEKMLAKEGKRIVNMTDVTVTKEKLVAAISKTGKIPGNEIHAFVERILKDVIMS
jgi:hypothetical protein